MLNAISKFAKNMAKAGTIKAGNKKILAEAKAIKNASKNAYRTAKLKGATIRSIARSAVAAAASKRATEVEKIKQEGINARAAMSKWNSIINQNPEPAEGTSNPVTPVGGEGID